jgi:hypothetical protein
MSFANGSSYLLDGGWTARLPAGQHCAAGQRLADD